MPRRVKSSDKCFYCQRSFLPGGPHASQATQGRQRTRDHIVPASVGGTRTVPCCRACNSIKGDMSPQEWLQFRRENPNWWADNWQWMASQVARKRSKADRYCSADFMTTAYGGVG